MDQQLASGSTRDPGLVGRTFGSYHILSLIQRGGMGEIYLAELARQKVKVVLKRLQEMHTGDERYVEMFHNEAAVMSELEHPNIVKVLGTPIIEDRLCLVMEFVRGRNLQQVLRRLRTLGRRLPPALGVHVMRKVLLGLHEAHQARFSDGRSLELVHRDVKPGNILISFAGDVKITDFGIAKSAMQNRLTTAGVVKGTVRYLSPEQIRSERISFRSDLFSCASVLVEVLTDQPLYDRGPVAPTLMAILNDDRAPIADLLPFRAPELCDVLERALRSRPEERHGSALELSQALASAGRVLGPPVSDDDVGSLLRQLFQSGSSEVVRDGVSPEDVTYLIANESPSSASGRLPKVPRGAEPLDAAAFKGVAEGTTGRPPPAPGSVEEGLPREFITAEARARSLLAEDVVFDEPVELSPSPPSASDLELDLDGLDLDDEHLDVGGAAPRAVDDGASAPSGWVSVSSRASPTPVRFGPPSSSGVPVSSDPSASGSMPIAHIAPARRGALGPSSSSGTGWALGQVPALEGGPTSSFPRVDDATAPPSEGAPAEGARLRLYLLAGCLGGILLTCAALALSQL